MIDPYIKELLVQMLEGKCVDPDGDIEAKVIQALRVSDEITDIHELCSALSVGGSWYAFPTLIARFQLADNQANKVIYFQALWGIRSRMDWDEDTLNMFLDAGFWKLRWVGTPGRFISLVMLLAGPEFQDQQKTEELAQAVAREMGFSFAPYSTFQEFKICTTDWNVEEDFQLVYEEVKQMGALDSLLDELCLSKELPSQVKESVIGMRHDYLLNRLGLTDNFSFYHTLLGRAMCLNVADNP
jgi:hypothetical protein